MKLIPFVFCLLLFTIYVRAQVEDVPISNSVYDFLIRLETKGLTGTTPLSHIPLQKQEIIHILRNVRNNQSKLSRNEINILLEYEKEFSLAEQEYSAVFPSKTNSTSIFWNGLIDNSEKVFYRYDDLVDNVDIRPLGSIDYIFNHGDSNRQVTVGTLGLKLSGTIDNKVGFFLQATNGRKITGDKELAYYNPEYSKSFKFTKLDSDIDLTQSHVSYQNGWFGAKIGRMEEKMGSGLFQSTYISTTSPPIDAISLTANFSNFKYTYYLGSLIGLIESNETSGINTKIASKFMNQHRFSVRSYWGEIAFWESVIYSDRGLDIAYLNPLSFIKSLEHQLHDRDNSIMGIDFSIRPFANAIIKSTFLLDDIIFEKIGTGYWSNKTAFNISGMYAFDFDLDFGLEYARVEPYTFSHFSPKNNYTNDNFQIGSELQPNSEQIGVLMQYWYGERFPVKLDLKYIKHGANEYDGEGNMIKNVGGDARFTRRDPDFQTGFPGDSYEVTFLDGMLEKKISITLSFGYEVVNNLYLLASYQYLNTNNKIDNYLRFVILLNEF